jgi:hypothetical protein
MATNILKGLLSIWHPFDIPILFWETPILLINNTLELFETREKLYSSSRASKTQRIVRIATELLASYTPNEPLTNTLRERG